MDKNMFFSSNGAHVFNQVNFTERVQMLFFWWAFLGCFLGDFDKIFSKCFNLASFRSEYLQSFFLSFNPCVLIHYPLKLTTSSYGLYSELEPHPAQWPLARVPHQLEHEQHGWSQLQSEALRHLPGAL